MKAWDCADLAKTVLFLLAHFDHPHTINVGVGEDVVIMELAGQAARVNG